jgi:RES domain-containing protein
MRGAFWHGARYNIRQYFGCLYTSLEVETARLETKLYFTVPPDCSLVEAAIELRLSRVVDLTDPQVPRKAGLRNVDLTGAHGPCQEIGMRAWESGVEALLVPSAASPRCKSLAVLLDNQFPRWSVRLRKVSG